MANAGFFDSMPMLDLSKRVKVRSTVEVPTKDFHVGPKPDGALTACDTDAVERRDHPRVGQLPVLTKDSIRMDIHEAEWLTLSGGCREPAIRPYHEGLLGLHGLHAVVPSSVHQEVGKALEKLYLISDHSYAWDILLNMMKNQLQCFFLSADLPKPYSDAMRVVLVDWLVQVHALYKYSDESLFLAVRLLDRSLRQMKVSKSNLQLLSVVCLLLAVKREHCEIPKLSELCDLMDNAYTKRQLMHMERKVLGELRFDLSDVPTSHYLFLSASIAQCSVPVLFMARYLLELSLLEAKCVVFLPAQVAAAALCLARRVIQEPTTPEGEKAWGVASAFHMCSETTMLRIMYILLRAAAKAHHQECRATFMKYSSSKNLFVSIHPSLLRDPHLLGIPAVFI